MQQHMVPQWKKKGISTAYSSRFVTQFVKLLPIQRDYYDPLYGGKSVPVEQATSRGGHVRLVLYLARVRGARVTMDGINE